MSSLAAAIVVGMMAFSAAPAVATEVSAPEATALAEFRTNLVERGDSAGVAKFDALNAEQRAELAGYFVGEVTPNFGLGSTSGTTKTQRDGDFAFSQSAAAPVTKGAALAAATIKNVWGKQWFSFAGIKITETKVSLNYYVSGGRATSVASYTCTVEQNADPTASITSSKAGSYISGSNAVGECKVVVKRGAPTPWGTWSWSTSSGIQYVTGSGTGSYVSGGWR
ncbi:hypothetical protein FQ142_07185 [Microbacterium sp. ANT_H45B]|uniref:hypothetical protein n=1 Tax=Microbacterium sp. ANT_H45B TaxID=2597346 RepID=UPI0011EF1068|nr:hypothetical protein [Microbacterium sp. ANT_H45B]KAA0960672.1 hypothetical protein FQ142_07185 [Microbacterium sp. ANT_H45B]